jgi:pumilio family protein 6
MVHRFENSEKGAVSNAIFHCALWEYLSEIELMEDQAEAEKLRRYIFELSVYRLTCSYYD